MKTSSNSDIHSTLIVLILVCSSDIKKIMILQIKKNIIKGEAFATIKRDFNVIIYAIHKSFEFIMDTNFFPNVNIT